MNSKSLSWLSPLKIINRNKKQIKAAIIIIKILEYYKIYYHKQNRPLSLISLLIPQIMKQYKMLYEK